MLVLQALFPEDPARRRRLARGLLLLAVAACVFVVLRALRKEGGVIELNRAFGARFAAGLDPWFDPVRERRVHGPYPPSLAWIAVPLSVLPLSVARGLWAVLQLAALVWIQRLFARRVREDFPAAAPHAPMLFAAAILLASRFLLRDFAGGGGNLIYAALAFAGVEAALREKPREGSLSLGCALPLGLSIALKPNLAPLVLFLALRGRFRATLSASVATLAFFWLPALSFGVEGYAGLAREWADGVVRYAALEELHDKSQVPAGLPASEDGMNQSLREAVARLARPPGDSGAVDVQVVELSAQAAAWLSRGLGLVLLALAIAGALRARDRRSEWFALLAFFPLALLVSPITWKAHHAALVPAFAGLCVAAYEARPPRRLLVFLIVYWLCCGLLSEDVVGREAKRALQAASIVTWFDVLLVGILALGLTASSGRRRGGPSGGPAGDPAGGPAGGPCAGSDSTAAVKPSDG